MKQKNRSCARLCHKSNIRYAPRADIRKNLHLEFQKGKSLVCKSLHQRARDTLVNTSVGSKLIACFA
jgi:hypothetical protein